MKYIAIVLIMFLIGCDSKPVELGRGFDDVNSFGYACMRQGKNAHAYNKDGKLYGICNNKPPQKEDVFFSN